MLKINQYSKFIVFLIILLNVIFAFTTLFVFLRTSTEPTTLIVSWFAFTTGELWLLSGITKSKNKIKKENDKDAII